MKQKQVLQCNDPLLGSRVCLQRLHPKHVDVLLESLNNEEFWTTYRAGQRRTYDRNQLQGQLQFEYQRTPAQIGKIDWLIRYTTSTTAVDDSPIVGLASLSAFDAQQSRAEFLIGFFDNAFLKPGLGLEASLLVLDYAFNVERLHKLTSIVYQSNQSAQKNTLSLGFSQEGILRSHVKLQDRSDFNDVYQNGFIEKDFRNNARLARLSLRLLGRDVTIPPDKRHSEGGASLSAAFEIG